MMTYNKLRQHCTTSVWYCLKFIHRKKKETKKMKAEEELRQMAIAHDIFCELNPKSKDTAISILRLLLVEETRPF